MNIMLFMLIFTVVQSEEKNGSCKDMLQGYLTGQLSSALGAYQIEALKREFKSFTDVIENSMKAFEKNVETKLRNIQSTSNGSAVYTRWGKKSCPRSAELVLSGYVGGSLHSHSGAAVDALCLPRNPEWGNYRDGRIDAEHISMELNTKQVDCSASGKVYLNTTFLVLYVWFAPDLLLRCFQVEKLVITDGSWNTTAI